MTGGREDSGGILPASPPTVRPIRAALSGISVAGMATGDPFAVAGDLCEATGIQLRDGATLGFDSGVEMVVAADVGTAANHVVFPGLVRREFVGMRGSVAEVVVCAPNLALGVVQWSGESTPERVTVTCHAFDDDEPGATIEVAERTDFGIVFRLAGDRYGVVVATPKPDEVVVSEAEGSVAFLLAPGTPSLVCCAGSLSDVSRALKAAPHLSGHVIRATAGPDREGLYVESGVVELDDGIAWARARLASVLQRIPADRPDDVIQCGLAALATGEEEIARTALLRLDVGSPERATLAGRFALAIGDPGPATSIAEALLSSGATGWARVDPWHNVALDALSAGLHNSAPELISGLRDLRSEAIVTPGGGRKLPVVGGAPPPLPAPEALIHEADELFRRDPDLAWRSWRETLGGGFDGGPQGPATWDAPGAAGCTTAAILLAFTHGCLGMEQDAPSGRLRFAPRFPTHLTRISVGGIRIGGARLRLDFQREPENLRYTFTPEFAGVPALLVFEPAVTGAVDAVLIDGVPAELDRRSEHGRTVVPVQFPLDGIRTIDIRLA